MRSNKILQLLKTKGQLTAKDIAALLGITNEGARQQLVRLLEEGLVVAESSSRGVGRPVQLYELSLQGNTFFPNNHAILTVELLEHVKEQFGIEGLKSIIKKREETNLERYRITIPPTLNLEEKLVAYARLRTEEGYMAETEKLDKNNFLFIENNCPICTAAETCGQFCVSDLHILKKLVGESTEVERIHSITQGERRCVYKISVAM